MTEEEKDKRTCEMTEEERRELARLLADASGEQKKQAADLLKALRAQKEDQTIRLYERLEKGLNGIARLFVPCIGEAEQVGDGLAGTIRRLRDQTVDLQKLVAGGIRDRKRQCVGGAGSDGSGDGSKCQDHGCTDARSTQADVGTQPESASGPPPAPKQDIAFRDSDAAFNRPAPWMDKQGNTTCRTGGEHSPVAFLPAAFAIPETVAVEQPAKPQDEKRWPPPNWGVSSEPIPFDPITLQLVGNFHEAVTQILNGATLGSGHYKCSACGQHFPRITPHDCFRISRKWECPHCDERFDTEESLVLHMDADSSDDHFVCRICDQRFVVPWDWEEFATHVLSHVLAKDTRLPKPLTCPCCSQQMDQLHCFRKHMDMDRGDNWKCKICYAEFGPMEEGTARFTTHILTDHCYGCDRKEANN